MALFGLHGWTLADLERYKHKGQWEERMKQREKKGTEGGEKNFKHRDGKGVEPRNTRKEFLLVRFQGQRQFSSCSHSSEINVLCGDLNPTLN